MGAIEGADAGSREKSFNQGYQAGYTVGNEFRTKYASLILLIAFGGGSGWYVPGALPGTKPKAK